MQEKYAVLCVSNVYDSSDAKGFKQSEHYPLAWEVIYHNDKSGKAFTSVMTETFQKLPKQEGLLLALSGEHTDMARSIEMVFSSADAFRKVVHSALKEMRLHQEQDGKIITKHQLIQDARSVIQQKEAALAV